MTGKRPPICTVTYLSDRVSAVPRTSLPYDICRCLGVDCALRESCLRHTDAPPLQTLWLAYATNLCNDVGETARIPA